jgi:hypothetical protein
MKHIFGAVVSFLLLLSAAHAEPAAIFTALEGKWSAKGNSFSPDAKAKMKWSETFAGKFYRVDYRIDMTLDGKPQSFEGVGHYQLADGDRIEAYWADSSGDLHPITAEISENAIVAHWGRAGAKQGRSEYRLNDDGSVLVTDWLLTADGWRQFNQATFRKGK